MARGSNKNKPSKPAKDKHPSLEGRKNKAGNALRDPRAPSTVSRREHTTKSYEAYDETIHGLWLAPDVHSGDVVLAMANI